MGYAPVAHHQHCIGIPVATCATGTRVPAVLQLFLRTPATLVTGLRRLEGARGGLNIHRTSFCRFVPEHAEKLCWSTVQNRCIESRLGRRTIGQILARYGIRLWLWTSDQVLDLQLFGTEGPRRSNQLCRLFVMEVLALPGNLAVQPCDGLVGHQPAPRVLSLPITGSISCLQGCFALAKKTRVATELHAWPPVAIVAKVSTPQSKASSPLPHVLAG